MKWLDRFTGKEEIGALRSMVEQQRGSLAIVERIATDAMGRLRVVEEKEQWVNILASDSKRELDKDTRNRLRERCIDVYYKTPEGKAIIENMTNYIVGGGVNWTAQDENPVVQEFIDKFCDAENVRFSQRQISTVKRTMRDGELFIHLIDDSKGFTNAMRFYPASEIDEVQTDPQDAEKPKAYVRKYTDVDGKQQEETIPAEEIHHIKIGVDEDISRGRPLLEPVMKRITEYEDWLSNRVILNKNRTSVVLEKIVEGSPSKVASVAASFGSSGSGAFSTDEYAVPAPKPGTVIVHSKNIEYKWNSPDIKAQDVSEDGRQIRLSIAAGVGMPEYILTSDASNANFASTMVSESPFVKAVEAWQKFFEEHFKIIFARVIQRGIDKGSLPKNSIETVMKESARRQINILKAMKEAAIDQNQGNQISNQIGGIIQDQTKYEEKIVPTKTQVDFEWPSIQTRNLWEETQAIDLHFTNGWCSKRTARMRFGYDPDEEDRIIEKEREEAEAGTEAYRKMKAETAGLDKKIQDRQGQDNVTEQ